MIIIAGCASVQKYCVSYLLSFIVVVFLFYVYRKELWLCRDDQLTTLFLGMLWPTKLLTCSKWPFFRQISGRKIIVERKLWSFLTNVSARSNILPGTSGLSVRCAKFYRFRKKRKKKKQLEKLMPVRMFAILQQLSVIRLDDTSAYSIYDTYTLFRPVYVTTVVILCIIKWYSYDY